MKELILYYQHLTLVHVANEKYIDLNLYMKIYKTLNNYNFETRFGTGLVNTRKYNFVLSALTLSLHFIPFLKINTFMGVLVGLNVLWAHAF